MSVTFWGFRKRKKAFHTKPGNEKAEPENEKAEPENEKGKRKGRGKEGDE